MKISQEKADQLAKFLMTKKYESLKKKQDSMHEKAAIEYSKQIPKDVMIFFEKEKGYFKTIASCYSLKNNFKAVRFGKSLPCLQSNTPNIIFSDELVQVIEDLHFEDKKLVEATRQLSGALYGFSSSKRIIENFPELANHELLKEPIKALVNIDEIKKLYK